jgi:hypothetical protein
MAESAGTGVPLSVGALAYGQPTDRAQTMTSKSAEAIMETGHDQIGHDGLGQPHHQVWTAVDKAIAVGPAPGTKGAISPHLWKVAPVALSR